ncbi:MAG: hypothetical protein ABJA62_12710 [Luteimonas sp.]
MNARHLATTLLASLAFIGDAVARDAVTGNSPSGFDQCWKATFNEQLSGPVREKGTSGGPYGFTYSLEGDFKWTGKPTVKKIDSEYVYCFRKRFDDGGVLIANGKNIELARLGSVKLQTGMHDAAGFSYASDRDPTDFPVLYGVFKTPGRPDTSLEIQLDRVHRATVVIANTHEGKQRMASYMQGDTIKLEP